MKLVMTVDIDMEESGLDQKVVKEAVETFARELLLVGAVDLEIGLTLEKVECEDVVWTKQ